jgi:Cd2+/Zn2+-exporting ATPase
MSLEVTSPPGCDSCLAPAPQPSFLRRYRDFFLATNTLITIANAILLVAGAIASLIFKAEPLANFLWVASALVGGSPIFLLAARGIRKGDLTAGVMVSVAMIAAILIGEYSAAALVAFMMMFGEILENFTMARANNALRELASLIPAQATVMRDGKPVLVPVDSVAIGDTLLVRNGERIPVDGMVSDGSAAVDQSAITGESVPVDKRVGDVVFAGTINTAGSLQVVAEKLGRDTTLGTIVKLVEEAQKTQAPVQRLANRYAQYLVPITFAIAAFVFFITGEIERSVTVLVVVCPCALVLATPTALVAAIGNAARHQAIIKTGASMEALGTIDVVAFDKTGTLTTGHPVVADVVPFRGLSRCELVTHAAAAEQFSEHPLGRSVVAQACSCCTATPHAHGVEILTGYGVRATANGRSVTVGNLALLASAGVHPSDDHRARITAMEGDGYTVIPVGMDADLAGLIALRDEVRPESAAVVNALKQAGIKHTVMISGDNLPAVRAVAGQVGVDEFHAQVLPQQKLDLIKAMQAEGHRVAYVGDGVNDAPALAVADLGIAMGVRGADVAIETASVALMSDDMRGLPHLLALARETQRTIRISVVFSMGMNLLALILSSLGVIGPAFGAVMHELSALPVLVYSARLVSFGYRGSPKDAR